MTDTSPPAAEPEEPAEEPVEPQDVIEEPEEPEAAEEAEEPAEESSEEPEEPTPAQAVINDLKALVVDMQQAFDAIRVTVQTKIEEILGKLSG